MAESGNPFQFQFILTTISIGIPHSNFRVCDSLNDQNPMLCDQETNDRTPVAITHLGDFGFPVQLRALVRKLTSYCFRGDGVLSASKP